MTDFLAEVNRLIDSLALAPDVTATALCEDGSTYLVLSDQPDKYLADDAWLKGFDAVLQNPQKRGSLTARTCRLVGVETTFLFAQTAWANEPLGGEAEKLAKSLFEIHDPRGLIRGLRSKRGVQHPQFASNEGISKYGDISSDFFRLTGLGNAVFVSDNSTLMDWCEASGLALEHANARIHEAYGVDVSDLNGGRLIDVFERIRQGEYYRNWQKEHDTSNG
jgi:hypothetical protein